MTSLKKKLLAFAFSVLLITGVSTIYPLFTTLGEHAASPLVCGGYNTPGCE